LTRCVILLDHKFSAVVITETWTDNSTENLVNIPGYSKIIKRRKNKRDGGVAWQYNYIDSELAFQPVDELNQMNSSDFESIFVNIQTSPNPITVGAIYRPPGNNLKQFNDSIEDLLGKMRGCRTNFFLAGDYNINLLNYEYHRETDGFLKFDV